MVGAPMAGRLGRVGPYALLESLGRGGMGEVYLAATRQGARVALKRLRDPIENDPDARLRLEREVRALRRVESPYVAQVLDADLSGDRPYLVMEYIAGETLLDAVRRAGPLSQGNLVELAQGLASALAIIHAGGVVHRDVKPANVLLAEAGPVLIDFGIAQVLDATRVTMTGTFLGTPGYCAPEVFADEPVGEPADVHGWAATVAFAATGRPTFGGGTVQSQMYAVLNGKADLVGVPAALLPLVRAALHRDPARRPTAALLADRLARLARASGDAAGRTAPGATPRTARKTPQKVVQRTPGAKADRTGKAAERPAVDVKEPATPGKDGGHETQAVDRRGTTDGPASGPRRSGASKRGPRTGDDDARRAGEGRDDARRAGEGRTESALVVETPPAAAEPEIAIGIPTGNAALLVLALLAVPCVVLSVIYPLATFAITAAFAVVTRALWTGHWLVRKRRSSRTRGVLRVLTFPLTLAGSAVSAAAWPGLPAAAAAFVALWITAGTRLQPDWWSQAVPVTVAGVAFGVVSGGILGREVERAGAAMPSLRREGLRALAVLGGFVALCAAAVQAVALFV
jgi:predicted Ser/Thr protein kinase